MTVKTDNKRRPAVRRAQLLETLENRQLLATFAANFNFQPASSAKPANYIADTGKTYSTQGSYTYGWDASNTANIVDRYTAADARYDTFAYLGKSATKWEVAVPNGTYRVSLTAGDPSSTSAHYALKVENSTLINETPHAGNRWSEGSGTVTVSDGRLTLTSGAGAWNNKVNSISITQLTSASTSNTNGAGVVAAPKAPNWAGTWSVTSNSLVLGWGDVSTNESGFIVEQSTNAAAYSEIARVGANVTSYNVRSLSAGTTYYYRVKSYNGSGSATSAVTTVKTTGASPAPTPTPTPTVSKPAAPSWVSSWANGQTAGGVNWGDASNNESGFIIQRSTDGANFSEIARVAANTTTYSVSGLTASKKYYFRVLSYNSAGNSNASATTSFTTAAASSGNNNNNNNGGGSNGAITNKFSLSGISANSNGDAASKYKAVLEDVGIKNVRIWYSFTNYNAQPDAWYINRALDYKRQGFTVMLAVLNPNPASSEAQAKSFFQRLANYPGLTAAVDYWQINNEPNMGSFWRGSLSQYVNLNLKPAYEVLKAKGETVVGAGPSWDVSVAKQLTSLGYLNYCDYAAFHPYGENADIVIQRARDARAAFNNKPMMVTEWNIQGISDQNRWVTELNKAAVGLSNIAYMNYYFALKQSATHVGVGGLLKYDGSKNTLFYNAVKGWLN